MLLKDVRAVLLAELARTLAPKGYRRREQTFVRDFERGQFMLHVAFVHHGGLDSDVTADVAVRHHDVENTLNANRTDLRPREAGRTATVGAELGNLAGDGVHRWTLTAASDVSALAAMIVERLMLVGDPFFRRFSSAIETLKVLEADNRLARLICPIPAHRTATIGALRDHLANARSNWRWSRRPSYGMLAALARVRSAAAQLGR